MDSRQNLHRLVTAALFAAAIAVMTAYLLHIPLPTGGYIHLGDALIYLAACLLPVPYAAAAAAIGAGLADLLTAPMWVLPFTSRGERLLCPRNVLAVVLAGVVSPTAYALAGCALMGSMAGFVPQFLGTLAQGVGSGVLFLAIAPALDGVNLTARLAGR